MNKNKKMYFGTNTKMYKTIENTKDFLTQLNELTRDIPNEEMELFVIPSYTSLPIAVSTTKENRILIGAQNMGWEDEGQFTGEISPVMLKEIGIDLVMVGHSERRHVLRETDFEEEKKVAKAISSGFKALLCIGETLQQKQYNLSVETLRTQLKIGLHSISAQQANNLIIAYEPVWSIGVSGIPATKEYAEEMHIEIKKMLIELYGEEIGQSIPVLYGGSVNNENCVGLAQQEHIDGLFIGRSAWNADNFNTIIRKVRNAL